MKGLVFAEKPLKKSEWLGVDVDAEWGGIVRQLRTRGQVYCGREVR